MQTGFAAASIYGVLMTDDMTDIDRYLNEKSWESKYRFRWIGKLISMAVIPQSGTWMVKEKDTLHIQR